MADEVPGMAPSALSVPSDFVRPAPTMRLSLRISKQEDDGQFLVDDPTIPGSPPVGRGRTMFEAIGSYFHHNQDRLGLSFEVHESALSTELARRRRGLGKR